MTTVRIRASSQLKLMFRNSFYRKARIRRNKVNKEEKNVKMCNRVLMLNSRCQSQSLLSKFKENREQHPTNLQCIPKKANNLIATNKTISNHPSTENPNQLKTNQNNYHNQAHKVQEK